MVCFTNTVRILRKMNNTAAGICQINVRPSPLFLVPACELPSPTNYPTTSTRKTITLGFFAKFRCTEAKQHLDVSLKLLAKRSGTVQELNCDLGVHAEKQNVHSLHPTNVHLRKSKESLAWNACRVTMLFMTNDVDPCMC